MRTLHSPLEKEVRHGSFQKSGVRIWTQNNRSFGPFYGCRDDKSPTSRNLGWLQNSCSVAIPGWFHKLGGLFVDVLVLRALELGIHITCPDFSKVSPMLGWKSVEGLPKTGKQNDSCSRVSASRCLEARAVQEMACKLCKPEITSPATTRTHTCKRHDVLESIVDMCKCKGPVNCGLRSR